MAEQLLQMKLLTSPEQYFQIINTGQLDSAFEGDYKQLMLIMSEIEKMMDGGNPMVSAFDRHSLHIKEHQSLIADADLREDPQLVENVIAHVMEHINLLRTTDPSVLAMMGEQPLPPPSSTPVQQAPMTGPLPPQQSGIKAPENDNISPVLEDQRGQGPVQTGEMGPQNLPKVPGVDSNMLPNPELQQASLGNVE
jgi:hypothetical protein